MVYIATEGDLYQVGLFNLNLNLSNPDTALAMDPMPNQKTPSYPHDGGMGSVLGQDIRAEFQGEFEAYLATAMLEQNVPFDHNVEEYGGYDPTPSSLDKNPEFTEETIALYEPVFLQPEHADMSLDSDSDESDGYDSTTLAESPESTGGIPAYGGTTASPVVDDTEHSQDIDIWAQPILASKEVQCLKCDNILYAMKGFRRHFDDLHADPEKCPRAQCDVKIIGKRKLKTHLERVHNEVTP